MIRRVVLNRDPFISADAAPRDEKPWIEVAFVWHRYDVLMAMAGRVLKGLFSDVAAH